MTTPVALITGKRVSRRLEEVGDRRRPIPPHGQPGAGLGQGAPHCAGHGFGAVKGLQGGGGGILADHAHRREPSARVRMDAMGFLGADGGLPRQAGANEPEVAEARKADDRGPGST